MNHAALAARTSANRLPNPGRFAARTLAGFLCLSLGACAATSNITEVLGVGDGSAPSEEARLAHAERTGHGILPPSNDGTAPTPPATEAPAEILDPQPKPQPKPQPQPLARPKRPLEATPENFLALGDYANAEALLRKRLSERETKLKAGDASVLQTLALIAETEARSGRLEASELTLTRLLVVAAPYGPADNLASQRGARLHMGRVYEGVGDDARAELQYAQALGLCTEAPERESESSCNVERQELARLLEFSGRSDEAEPLLMQALGAVQRDAGPHDIRLSNALADIAAFHERSGKYHLAEPLFARAADIWETALLDAYQAWSDARATGQADPFGPSVSELRPDRALFTVPPLAEREIAMLRRLGRDADADAARARLSDRWRNDNQSGAIAESVITTLYANTKAQLSAAARLAEARSLHAAGWVALRKADPRASAILANAEQRYSAAWPEADKRLRRIHAADLVSLALHRSEVLDANETSSDRIARLDRAATLASAALPETDFRRYEPVVARAHARREAEQPAEAEAILLGYDDSITAVRGATHPDIAWGLRNLTWVYEALGDRGSAVAVEREAQMIWDNWSPQPAYAAQ